MSRNTKAMASVTPIDGRTAPLVLLLTPDAGRAGRIAAELDRRDMLTTVVLTAPHALRSLDRVAVDAVLVDLRGSEPAPALLRAVSARTDAPILGMGRVQDATPDLYPAGLTAYLDLAAGERCVAEQVAAYAQLGAPAEIAGYLESGRVVVDLDRRELRIDGTRIAVTPLQLRLVASLAAADGRVVTHAELYRAVWGQAPDDSGERLATAVYRLRVRLDASASAGDVLASVRGQGYRLDDAVAV